MEKFIFPGVVFLIINLFCCSAFGQLESSNKTAAEAARLVAIAQETYHEAQNNKNAQSLADKAIETKSSVEHSGKINSRSEQKSESTECIRDDEVNKSLKSDSKSFEGNEAVATESEESDKTFRRGEALNKKPSTSEKPLDRPWIIKQKSKGKAKTEIKQPSSIKWRNDSQKIQCETYLKDIRKNFLKARYYSIQGDPCNTANYAKRFLSLVEQCKRDCPQRYLEESGYTAEIVRNLQFLHKSGSERCLGPSEPVKK